jgi:hypothetical protein
MASAAIAIIDIVPEYRACDWLDTPPDLIAVPVKMAPVRRTILTMDNKFPKVCIRMINFLRPYR